MPKYRKKPIVVDAVQITRALLHTAERWPPWLFNAWQLPSEQEGSFTGRLNSGNDGDQVEYYLHADRGEVRVYMGDYIIRGAVGELYPCRPSVFESTYEALEDEDGLIERDDPPAVDFDPAFAGKPFLKWAGGKRRILDQLTDLLPLDIMRRAYHEPFLGGGAPFFGWRVNALNRDRWAALSDANPALINTYRRVRDDVEGVIGCLEALVELGPYRAHYYELRDRFNARRLSVTDEDRNEHAALFIYLNRTCFNGLYRENQQGAFNVPVGRYKNPAICDGPGLRQASRALRFARITCADYAEVLEGLGGDAFVYLDPPYAPLDASSFTTYTKHGFNETDQRRLASLCVQLHKRGARFLLSNHDTPLIRELYGQFIFREIKAPRTISSKGSKRAAAPELAIRNYV